MALAERRQKSKLTDRFVAELTIILPKTEQVNVVWPAEMNKII